MFLFPADLKKQSGWILYLEAIMKKCSPLFLFLCVFVLHASGQNGGTDESMRKLDRTISQRESFDKAKRERIDELKRQLRGTSPQDEFALTTRIFDEYKSFIYDSAFRYAMRLQGLANKLNDPARMSVAKINLGFVLVSAGLFNESLDTLHTLKAITLPDSLKGDFYFLMGRTYYDLAEFNRDSFYNERYRSWGNRYLDSALQFLPLNTPEYLVVLGLKAMHTNDYAASATAYEKLLIDFDVSGREEAVATSTLSFIYGSLGRSAESREMLVRAVISDIESSTKETVALRNLAEALYREGNIEKAHEYIRIAMDDASFYGANHRVIQVASIFPLIEGHRHAAVEARNTLITVYAVGITLFALLLIGFGFIVYKQNQKLETAKQVISESNAKLMEANHQLLDSNKIKEEYITYYFNSTADYISKLENLKKTMEMKLRTRSMEDLRFTVDSINIKHEREELFVHFDKFFLRLFPDFVTIFQSLFREEDRIQLKEGQLLNTELRIFALIRLGIRDNEKIARILDYSVTTIYTYKTRIRNKSIAPAEFDKRIMAIPTI
jgi:Response regulator containing a CheY-like receiver domain and an HTH DNA-binding domain